MLKTLLQYKIIILIAVLFITCHKKVIVSELNASYEFNNAIRFPNDSVLLHVVLNPTGGTAPYTSTVDVGKKLTYNTYEIKFKTTLKCTAKINDASGRSKTIVISANSRDFDSLQYDYRKPYIGTYIGTEVSFTNTSINNSPVTIKDSPLNSTVNISADNNFSLLRVNICPNAYSFNYNTNIISGGCGSNYIISGKFKSDSLIFVKGHTMNGSGINYYLKKIN